METPLIDSKPSFLELSDGHFRIENFFRDSFVAGASTRSASLNSSSLPHLPVSSVSLSQVHQSSIAYASDSKKVVYSGCDAVYSSTMDLALCVKTADCVPLLLAHDYLPVFALSLIHI